MDRMTKMIARLALGFLGTIISAILFLFPLRTFLRIRRARSTDGLDELPYLLAFLSCMVTTVYDLPITRPHELLGSTIYGAGNIIYIAYIVILLVYSNQEWGRVRLVFISLAGEIIMVGCFVTYVLLDKDQERRTLVMGVISGVINVGSSMTSIPTIRRVVTTHDVDAISFYTTLFSSANGICGIAYAFIPFTPLAAIPTIIVTIIAVAQIIVYFIYRHGPEEPSNVELAQVVVEEGVIARGSQDERDDSEADDSGEDVIEEQAPGVNNPDSEEDDIEQQAPRVDDVIEEQAPGVDNPDSEEDDIEQQAPRVDGEGGGNLENDGIIGTIVSFIRFFIVFSFWFMRFPLVL